MKAVVLALFLLATPALSHGSDSVVPKVGGIVSFMIVCDLGGVMQAVKEFVENPDADSKMPLEGCAGYGTMFYAPISDVIYGPAQDAEGDTMYVVQLEADQDTYTIVWPILNYHPAKLKYEDPNA